MTAPGASLSSKMKKLNLGSLLVLLLFTASSFAQATELKKRDVLLWPRATVLEFSTFLQKEFHVQDAHPAGARFPDGRASSVNPLFSKIELTWEQGALQAVVVTLKKKMTEARAKAALKLPSKVNYPRPNVMNYDVQQCSLKATCVVIQGFDHQGAGD